MPVQKYLCRCFSLWIALTRYSYTIKQVLLKVPSEGLNIFWKQLLLVGQEVLCEQKSCFRATGAARDSSPWVLFMPFYPTSLSSSPISCPVPFIRSNQSLSLVMSHCLPYGTISAVKNIRLAGNPTCLFFCKTITFSSKGLASYKPGHSPTWNSLALHLNKKIFSLLSITK